jgi:hypothetical protein
VALLPALQGAIDAARNDVVLRLSAPPRAGSARSAKMSLPARKRAAGGHA